MLQVFILLLGIQRTPTHTFDSLVISHEGQIVLVCVGGLYRKTESGWETFTSEVHNQCPIELDSDFMPERNIEGQ